MQTKLEGKGNEYKECCIMERDRWKEDTFSYKELKDKK